MLPGYPALPFFENYSRTIRITLCVSLLLHVLALRFFAMPQMPREQILNAGISIELEMADPSVSTRIKAEADMSHSEVLKPDRSVPARPTPPRILRDGQPKVVSEEPKPRASRKPGSGKARQQTAKQVPPRSPAAQSKGEQAPVPKGGSETPQPRYPELARKRGQEGTVEIRCHVDESGRVTDVAVSKSSGFRLLDDAALNTLSKWRFRPGLRNGVNAGGTVVVPVQFKLQ